VKAETTCLVCARSFLPSRKDQRYCSRQCQRNATRPPRKIADSTAARRTHETRKGRIEGLSNAFYETHPAYRAEFMEKLIVEARGNAELRRLITVRALLRSWLRRRETGRLHIAHVLDHYCQEVYGMRSYEFVDPKTELPSQDDLTFPAAYFGPDEPSIYEDGGLNERPCPWETWKKERQSASTNI